MARTAPHLTIPQDGPPPARARPSVDDADLRGPLDRGEVQRALPRQPRQGPDRPLDRLRPADADRLRRRPRARPRRGRQGRRAGRPPRRHAGAARRHPARPDEHVDDDQRDGRLAARALHRRRRGAGRRPALLQGTTQNDILKEYLSRGHLRLPARAVDAADRRHGRLHGDRGPEVEPDQHLLLPPPGGRGDAGPGDRLRDVQRDRRARRRARARRREPDAARSSRASPSSSTPACASSRSTRSCARCRSSGTSSAASATAWRIPRQRRFRYGVQVNSLGLTEAQPENNVQRIVLEALAVTLGRNARARAIQLPAWNEALGLPRPWDQQWSLRIQQVLAYETDLLEYPDIFEGSTVMDGLVAELLEGARAEMAVVAEHGGAVEAVPYMKAALVESHRERIRRIESGEQIVVGQNRFTETEESPLTADAEGGHPRRRPRRRGPADATRSARGGPSATRPRSTPRWPSWRARARGRGEHHAARRSPPPAPARRPASGRRRCATRSASTARRPASARRPPARRRRRPRRAARRGRARLRGARPAAEDPRRQARPRRPLQRRRADRRARARRRHGRRLRGHPADARRRSPPRRCRRASTSSGSRSSRGSHRELIPAVIDALREAGVDVPVVVGGIIPDADVAPPARGGRGRGLHAEGLRPHADHARHRRARGRAQRGRGASG